MLTTSVLLVGAQPIMALALLLGGCCKDGPPSESQVTVKGDDEEISNPGGARIVGASAPI